MGHEGGHESHKGTTWIRSELQGIMSKYKQMAYTLAYEPELAVGLASVVKPTESDKLASNLVDLSFPYNRTIQIIRALIEDEFKRAKSQTTILRLNSVASRAAYCYIRKVGVDYLNQVLGETIASLVNSTDSLEVDPQKITNADSIERRLQIAAQNAVVLQARAQEVLKKVLSDDSIVRMPRMIRAIAGIIRDYATQHGIDPKPLVGGFIMLRYFNPALLTPEAHGLLPPGVTAPSPLVRRNLILIAKLLQNLSNDVEFGEKEEYMIPCNPFIVNNRQKIQEYFDTIASDPEREKFPARGSWFDVFNVTRGQAVHDVLSIRSFELADLISLHRSIASTRNQLLPLLSPFVKDIISHLGDPPKDIKAVSAPEQNKALRKASIRRQSNLHLASSQANLSQLPENVVYMGGTNKDGHPVIYIVVNRIPHHFFSDPRLLAKAVADAAGSIICAGPYAVCLDMSWVQLPSHVAKDFLEDIPAYVEAFRNLRGIQNCTQVYWVHPGEFGYHILCILDEHLPKDVRDRCFEVHRARALTRWILPSHISLPKNSTWFLTESFFAGKVNRKGVVQFRLAKVTGTALLNIEPETRKILNVKNLRDVEKLVVVDEPPTVVVHFDQPKKRSGIKALVSEEAPDVRLYLLDTITERDELAKLILWAMIDPEAEEASAEDRDASAFLTFKVDKISTKKKLQPRLVQMTKTAILLLSKDGGLLKKEIDYNTIDSVELWRSDANVLEITLSHDCAKIHIRAEDAAQLLRLIRLRREKAAEVKRRIRDAVNQDRVDFFLALMAVMRWRAKVAKKKFERQQRLEEQQKLLAPPATSSSTSQDNNTTDSNSTNVSNSMNDGNVDSSDICMNDNNPGDVQLASSGGGKSPSHEGDGNDVNMASIPSSLSSSAASIDPDYASSASSSLMNQEKKAEKPLSAEFENATWI